MSLKIFITILFLFSFVFTSVSHADKPVLRKFKKDSTKKTTSLKSKHLNGDLAILEKSMERKVDNKAFSDIYKRYIGLTRQYGETDRAINFIVGLAERHPQSQNVLAISGSITYDLRKKT
ncbi:MAG: hypothetical protein ACYST3_06240 [Planctomycetota bacterium]|jgi:hypothetical protein